MVLDLREATEAAWREVFKKLDKAAVFIDEPLAEVAHFHGKLRRFTKSGITSIRDFSSFESGKEDEKKGVFLVSSPVVGSTRMILRDIISSSHFEHCVLISSCSPQVLNLATTGNVPNNTVEMTAIHKLEMDMLQWMKGEDYPVEIFHFPLAFVPITDYFFACPPFRDFIPFTDTDFKGKVPFISQIGHLEIEELPLDLQVEILHLATTLNQLLNQLNVKEDLFCLGQVSHLICSQLSNQSANSMRSKTPNSKASLIILDRTVDLGDAVSFGSGCFLDLIKNALPPGPAHGIDVYVDMTPVTTCKEKYNPARLIPGSLYHQNSNMFDVLINKNPTEVLKGLAKRVVEAEPKSSLPSRLTVQSLENLVLTTIGLNYADKKQHLGLLQECLAVTSALNSPLFPFLEMGESLQKLILQLTATENGCDDCLSLFCDLIRKRKEKGVNLQVIFSLLVYFYNLVGSQFELKEEREKELEEALKEALLEERDTEEPLPLPTFTPPVDELNVDSVTLDIMRKLGSIKNIRKNLVNYKNVAVHEGPVQPIIYKSILTQMLSDIVDVNRPYISDLTFSQSGLVESLASRFSFLTSAAKCHPMDNDTIIFFIVGGICGHEVKLIKDCFKAHTKNVIVGSTNLVSHNQILNLLFNKDPIKPFGV